MFKSKILLITLLLTILLPAGTVLAEEPAIIWWAEYFDNPKLEGNPVRAIREAEIDYDWGKNAPLAGVPADGFSVRWTTKTNFAAGNYTFTAVVDDGVRLWVDGKLLIDAWKMQSATIHAADTNLTAGTHTVQMAYYDNTGDAVAKLWWRQNVQAPPTPPSGDNDSGGTTAKTLIIDNSDKGFIWGGPLAYRNKVHGGYGQGFFWTQNTSTWPTNYGKWTPTFTAPGDYEIFVYVPGNHATTAQLRYRVLHDGQRHDKLVDQDWYFDKWISLGTYHFNGKNEGKEFILAYDNTREHAYSTQIAFDAVKLVPVKK